MMFISIVTSRVMAEKVGLYEQTFRELRKKVLANEPGVSFYELCRVSDAPHTYKVVEAYDSQQTQNSHLVTDYYQAAIKIIVDCLEGGSYEHVVCETI
jgi:quinol monooxygenase YgiN